MKIAILGAGFSGLTAGYRLAKKGHEVHIFEKAAKPGGAAGGFKLPGWNWYLDYAYHHSFISEKDILSLASEIGYPKFLVQKPETASLYNDVKNPDTNANPFFEYLFGPNNKSYKLDSAIDLLRFERIPFLDRLRTGAVLAWLKFGPKLNYYDRALASKTLKKTMGQKAYQELWKPLFEKKFAHFYKDINMGFFWARLRRSAKLTYPIGGYQKLANSLASAVEKQNGHIHYQTTISKLSRNSNSIFNLYSLKKPIFKADIVINTLQTPVFLQIEKNVLPSKYRKRLAKIKYLGAQNVIIQSKQPILPHTYWLSLAAKPTKKQQQPGRNWMVGVQQTNFVSQKHYNNQHLFYLGAYTNSPKKFEIKDKKLAQKYKIVQESYIKYGQPLYTPEFVRVKPNYTTPVANLYFANMELTYPYDRGTNQAVGCGERVAKMIK